MTIEQTKVNRMLTRGVVYSIIWLAGLGSCYALHQGILARRLINENPALEGNGRAWWCIIVGGVGAAAMFLVVGIGIFNAMIRP
ncbi:hypothetical protein [Mesorhizobium amorphae]